MLESVLNMHLYEDKTLLSLQYSSGILQMLMLLHFDIL